MHQSYKICGLVLAAGMSSRMGDFKPLMPFRGKTLLENTVDSMLQGGAQRVVVVTGYRGDEIESLLGPKYGAKVIFARNAEFATKDMLHSVQVGCGNMPDCDAFFLLPGDMPVVCNSTFQRVLDCWNGTKAVIFPTLDGYRKHPPLIDARLIPEICDFAEEGGLRQLWKKHEDLIRTVAVEDLGVWVDLDTPEAYARCVRSYDTPAMNLKSRVVETA